MGWSRAYRVYYIPKFSKLKFDHIAYRELLVYSIEISRSLRVSSSEDIKF